MEFQLEIDTIGCLGSHCPGLFGHSLHGPLSARWWLSSGRCRGFVSSVWVKEWGGQARVASAGQTRHTDGTRQVLASREDAFSSSARARRDRRRAWGAGNEACGEGGLARALRLAPGRGRCSAISACAYRDARALRSKAARVCTPACCSRPPGWMCLVGPPKARGSASPPRTPSRLAFGRG